jgi:hypothetical protein
MEVHTLCRVSSRQQIVRVRYKLPMVQLGDLKLAIAGRQNGHSRRLFAFSASFS